MDVILNLMYNSHHHIVLIISKPSKFKDCNISFFVYIDICLYIGLHILNSNIVLTSTIRNAYDMAMLTFPALWVVINAAFAKPFKRSKIQYGWSRVEFYN